MQELEKSYNTILKFLFFSIIFLVLVITTSLTEAKIRRKKTQGNIYKSALLIEAETGKILKSFNPHKRVIPASIVKMMTSYIALREIQNKNLSLNEFVFVSRKASKIGGQQVYLAQGEKFRVIDLLKAIMISSANDAAYALAEHISGSSEGFTDLMNVTAKELGMRNTRFINVNGLPPNRGKPPNLMSAEDAGILARALLKIPMTTKFSSIKNEGFRKNQFVLTNTNLLIGRFPGLDGLKTGFYRKAGFSIVATAKKSNLRLIAIVFGAKSSRVRFSETSKLLSWGFNRYMWLNVKEKLNKNTRKIKILDGVEKTVELKMIGKKKILIRRENVNKISIKNKIPDVLTAPISKGQIIGKVTLEIKKKKVAMLSLVTKKSVQRISFLRKILNF
ncbi:MAG: D-alanyl-D-alanine carboxypeptidase family protein [Nitrospinota bacterium]|nr:D-alanyl-D-alanine carboxypeptidase family protein [Nitrospinota bacterium]